MQTYDLVVKCVFYIISFIK